MQINKISKDLVPDNTLQDIKREKAQKEQYQYNYESEKSDIERAKEDVVDIADLSNNPAELEELLIGLSTNPSLLNKYRGIKNQPDGWKNFVILKILNNNHTPSSALNECWNKKIKPMIIMGEAKLEGITTSGQQLFEYTLLKHQNCPPSVIEEFSEILLQKQWKAPVYKCVIGDLLSNKDDLTPKTLDNLYKIDLFNKSPSFQQQIATHPNAPINAAVNYVLSSQNAQKVNHINNTNAIEFIAKINKSVIDFSPATIEKIIKNRYASTEVLEYISNLRKDIEKSFNNNQEQINANMNALAATGNETVDDFLTRIEDEIRTMPNAPVNDEQSRKNAMLIYYTKYRHRDELQNKIKTMLDEFKDKDFVISVLYEKIADK